MTHTTTADEQTVATRAEEVADWEAFIATRSPAQRERFITSNIDLVERVARRVGRRLPSHIALDDLIQFGNMGLIDAVDRFSPHHGSPFRAYAATRIHGAIVDGLRGLDWAPRSVRARHRQMTSTMKDLQETLLRDPTREELAAALSITLDELNTVMATPTFLHSLNESSDHDDGGGELAASLPSSRTADDNLTSLGGDVMEIILGAIDDLPPVVKTVLTLYYIHGYNFSQIASLLGLNESRACTLHGGALLWVRDRLLLDDTIEE